MSDPQIEEARFWAKVDKAGAVPQSRPDLGPCWNWTAFRNPAGYGMFGRLPTGGSWLSHRYAYVSSVGSIPDGLQIDHLCRNTSCVNPSHLEPVSSRENTLRSPVSPSAVNARMTKCAHGHDFDGHNGRQRTCSRCAQRRQQEWRARTKEYAFA